jgi:hypothetical protein
VRLDLTRELEGKGRAMDDAVATWERQANGMFGEEWKLWTNATDKSVNCGHALEKGGVSGVTCTVSGRACSIRRPSRP